MVPDTEAAAPFATAPLLIAFLFIAIVTVVIFAFVKLLGSTAGGNSLANRDSSSEQDNVIPAQTDLTDTAHVEYGVMPQLVGRNYTLKHDEMASSGWLYLEPEYVFSDSIIKDTIMEQELTAGTEFVIGSTMKVTVSLGPSLITIPPYKGMRLNAYLNQLKEMGLVEAIDGDGGSPAGQTQKNGGKQTTTTEADVPANEQGKKQVVMYRAKVDYNYSNGYVCAVDPAAGKVIDAMEDYRIIVYYAYNPVYTTINNGTTGTTNSTTSTSGKGSKTTGTTTATTAKPTETQPPQTQAPQTQAPQTQAPQTQAPVEPPPTPPETPAATPDPT